MLLLFFFCSSSFFSFIVIFVEVVGIASLGALSGVGTSQWGTGDWKKAYEGMIRSIATWGAELGWRGQKAWEKEFSRLQYQALRKVMGAVKDTAIDKVNLMAGVEDVLDNCQARFVARCVEGPTKLGDIMPVGFGDEMRIDDELTEEGGGRRWDDHSPQWVGKQRKKGGFVSTLTQMVSILPEGKPLWGGSCRKVDIVEVDVRPPGGKDRQDDHKNPDAWEKEISRVGKGGAYVYSDGSLLDGGKCSCCQECTARRRAKSPYSCRLESSHCRGQESRQDG